MIRTAHTLPLLLVGALCISAGNILMMPHPIITSHQRLYMRLADQLLARGHRVTILRWHPSTPPNDSSRTSSTTLFGTVPPPAAATIVNLDGPLADERNRDWIYGMMEAPLWTMHETVVVDHGTFMLQGILNGLSICVYTSRSVSEWRELFDRLRAQNFTLGVVDPSGYPGSWVVMNQVGIPYIDLAPNIPVYYQDKAAHTPTPFSYVPSMNSGNGDRMDFIQRVRNTIDHPVTSSSFYWVFVAWTARLVVGWRRTENTPLMVLMLDEKLVAYSRPYTNALLTIGLTPRVTTPVNDSIAHFTNDGHTKGTIVLSLTTIGKEERMPQRIRQIFLDAFRDFPDYRVIWRTLLKPPTTVDDSTRHIRYTKWFNQTNLFADPSMKLLITHGGIATILEAVRHGVPMLGIPLAYDHHSNVGRVIARGMGAKVTKETITRQLLTDAMRLLLHEKSMVRSRCGAMREMLASTATLFDDQMLWYTELAMRHGDRLRWRLAPAGEGRSTFVYFGLDILLLVLGLMIVIFVLIH